MCVYMTAAQKPILEMWVLGTGLLGQVARTQ